MASLLGNEQNAVNMVGFLVEKLGGAVTLTQAEVEGSLTAKGGTLYVEVDVVNSTLHLEVFPKGMNHGQARKNSSDRA